MTIQLSDIKSKRERRFYFVLPLLIVPFVLAGFWALGGGKGDMRITNKSEKGLNVNLPAPLLTKDSKNKMGYYEIAEKKAAKLKELIDSDPYYTHQSDTANSRISDLEYSMEQLGPKKLLPMDQLSSSGEMEEKVNSKLQQLEMEVNRPEPIPAIANVKHVDKIQQYNSDEVEETNLLGSELSDPNLNQLDGMLNKILDIQYPDRVTNKTKKQSEEKKGFAFPIVVNDESTQTSFFTGKGQNDSTRAINQNRFLGQSVDSIKIGSEQLNILAVVEETQTIMEGSSVKLRLLSEIVIDGAQINRGQVVYGIASVRGERLQIKISGIRCHGNLYPVALRVFDLDAMEGVYIPGLINREVVKQSTDNAVRNLMLNSINPSIGAQAASAGVETAKNLVGKKVRLVKVTLKSGHQLFLCNEKK